MLVIKVPRYALLPTLALAFVMKIVRSPRSREGPWGHGKVVRQDKKIGTHLCSYFFILAEWTGLEPATPCLTGMYSNQLNYHSEFWWVLRGSNPRPSPCKGDALPAELSTQFVS
jgi:hypothetical protein